MAWIWYGESKCATFWYSPIYARRPKIAKRFKFAPKRHSCNSTFNTPFSVNTWRFSQRHAQVTISHRTAAFYAESSKGWETARFGWSLRGLTLPPELSGWTSRPLLDLRKTREEDWSLFDADFQVVAPTRTGMKGRRLFCSMCAIYGLTLEVPQDFVGHFKNIILLLTWVFFNPGMDG